VPGFANIGEYVGAMINGQISYASIRKVSSSVHNANTWSDFSVLSGEPSPNYYASSPLIASALDGKRGIFHGTDKSPAQLYLSSLSLTNTQFGFNCQFILLDYLLYYPFVDGDNSGTQTMTNTTSLTRYTSGEGVKAMFVSVAQTVGGGAFTFDYINQDGVQKTSPVHDCDSGASSPGQLITTQAAAVVPAYGPFLRLADGDTGIRSIVSVTNSLLNGGLGTIVLVRPLADIYVAETGTTSEITFGDTRSVGPRIYDGAYLGLIGQTTNAFAGATLVGLAKFVWN